MPTYSITIPGTMDAAHTKLESENLPALLRRAQETGVTATHVRREVAPTPAHCRVREPHRVTVFRELADSFKSGMPLQESLRLIAHETHDRVAKHALRKLLENIQSGDSFADAARKSPELFTETDLALLDAGERGSALDEVFTQLAEITEMMHSTARRVGEAFIYPGILSFFALGVVTFMLVFNVPRFTAIFEDFHTTLPGPTALVVALSRVTVPILFLMFWGGLLFLILLLAFRRTWAGRVSFDFWQLRLPLMNHVLYRLAVARGCGMMSLLTRHAVPLADALHLAGQSCGNPAMRRGFAGAGIALANGETLSRSLEESEAFPEALVWRVALAESSGNVSEAFWQMAAYYSEQAESKTRILTSILEPALILVLGGAMGFIVIAMFLPLVQILSSLMQ